MSEEANDFIQSNFGLDTSIEDDFFTLERPVLRMLLELYAKKKLKEAEDGKYCFGCGYPKDPEPYTDANAPRICKNVMCKENELKKQQNNE